MNKLVCMGEALVDFMPDNMSTLSYTAKAGGAPANVCCCVAKLGAHACYFGKLSNDNFSKFLKLEMDKYGIDTSYIICSNAVKTGLTFVDLDNRGDREFFFYRDCPADENLYPEEVPDNLFNSGDVLHFCSFDLVECPSKHSHEKAIFEARDNGALVSFDINARLHMWKDENKLVDTCYEFIPLCDIIKCTDDELFMLTKEKDEINAIKSLFAAADNAKLIFVTKGKNGSSVYDRTLKNFHLDAIGDVVVDTTGAGDCFIGTILYNLLTKQALPTIDGIKNAAIMANTACSIVISKKGAMNSMPTLEELQKIL